VLFERKRIEAMLDMIACSEPDLEWDIPKLACKRGDVQIKAFAWQENHGARPGIPFIFNFLKQSCAWQDRLLRK
jgi:hypothetical protein